jgi:hypothetical protein
MTALFLERCCPGSTLDKGLDYQYQATIPAFFFARYLACLSRIFSRFRAGSFGCVSGGRSDSRKLPARVLIDSLTGIDWRASSCCGNKPNPCDNHF